MCGYEITEAQMGAVALMMNEYASRIMAECTERVELSEEEELDLLDLIGDAISYSVNAGRRCAYRYEIVEVMQFQTYRDFLEYHSVYHSLAGFENEEEARDYLRMYEIMHPEKSLALIVDGVLGRR